MGRNLITEQVTGFFYSNYGGCTSCLILSKGANMLEYVFCYYKTGCPSCVAVVRSSELNTQTCVNETYIPFNT